MANTIEEQKLIDTQKRALLKYVFVGDGTEETDLTLIDASNLAFSLNANGQVMSSNTHSKTRYRTAINRIWGTAGITAAGGYITLDWNNTPESNNLIVAIKNGAFDFNFVGDGAPGGVIRNPNTDAANASGDIQLTTVGTSAGDVFTLFVDLKKDNQDYDAGQTADPHAFNIGIT
jgi:hypothetical protein